MRADPGDFQAFVLARRAALLRTAWLLTGDWHAAEDLVQIALMNCYPHWRRVAGESPDAYVRRAIFHAHVSRWRRRWRGEISTSKLPERHSDVDVFAAADERRTMVAALLTLPARQRATLVLRYYEDLSEAETAAVLGCSVGTVKSQTVKALSNLRRNGVLLDQAHHTEVAHD